MLFYTRNLPRPEPMVSVLSAAGYYNFLSGLMITLFIACLVIVFVYEYEVLRRPKA